MKIKPKFDLYDPCKIRVGDFRDCGGRVMEIHIRPGIIEYGIQEIEMTWGKTLLYLEEELERVV